jgi:hypothetical protein
MATPALTPPSIFASVILAEAAQVSEGKLFLLGGGLAIIPAQPKPLSLALLIQVPWDRGDERLDWVCELLDEDGAPVLVGEVPVLVNGQFQAGRPPTWPEGAPLSVPIAINFSALPLQAGRRYTWRLAIDGATEPEWQTGFSVANPPAQAT